jgi:hypothetical protein
LSELCHGSLDRIISKTWRRFTELWVERYMDTGHVVKLDRSGCLPALRAPQKTALAKAAEKADSIPAAVAIVQDKGNTYPQIHH